MRRTTFLLMYLQLCKTVQKIYHSRIDSIPTRLVVCGKYDKIAMDLILLFMSSLLRPIQN